MSNERLSGGGPQIPEFERIVPIDFGLPSPQHGSRQNPSAIFSWIVWLGFAVLLIAAAGVFFLPTTGLLKQQPTGFRIQTTISRAPAPSSPGDSAPLARTDASAQLAPWQQTELQRERREAEKALAILVQKHAALEEQGVRLWGGQRFTEAKLKAAAGDRFFLKQDYKSAAKAYTQGASVLKELTNRVDSVLDEAVNAARSALAHGDASQATEQFKLVLAIDPDNTEAKEGLVRAANLDEAQRLMRAGAHHEAKGMLQAASADYKAALKLYPDSKQARHALDKIAYRITEQKFNQAMSEGFIALEAKHLEVARKAFRTARALKPNSAEAMDGLAQVDLNFRLQKIAFHRSQAAQLEQRENWQAAAKHYRAALDQDPNLLFAKRGRIRALARARLAQQLEFHIQHPGRLSSDSVYAQAISIRDQALKIESKGPRLRKQLAEISKLLTLAATPVRVRLESDNLTEVVVYKVGELGTFDVRELKLRPGYYTAVGSRDGYRDVRREFTVIAGETPEPVVVRCNERI
jgi:hypothetical protein